MAQQTTNKRVKLPGGEIGNQGIPHYDGWPDIEYNDRLQHGYDVGRPWITGEYEKMRNDPALRTCELAVVLPLLAAEWYIEPAPDSGPKGQEIADFVDEALFQRLATPWPNVLRSLSTGLRHGFAPLAKAWRAEDGKIWLDKLVLRRQQSIERFIVVNDELQALHQYDYGSHSTLWGAGSMDLGGQTITIEAKDLLLWSNEQEGNGFAGYSWYRPCYFPWRTKVEAMRDLAIMCERMGVGIPQFTPEGDTKLDAEDVARLREMGAALRVHAQGVFVYHKPVKAEWLYADADGALLINTIKLANEEIYRAWLQGMQALGSSTHGSLAQATENQDLAYLGIEAIGKDWCTAFNGRSRQAHTGVIKQIVDAEFPGQTTYPALRVANVRAKSLEKLGSVIGDLGLMARPWPELVVEVARLLGLPEPPDEWLAALDALPEPEPAAPEIEQLPAPDEDEAEGPDEEAAPETEQVEPGQEDTEAVDPQSALNGAQVQAMLQILQAVADGSLPRESAAGVLKAAFPLTEEQIEKILGELGAGFVPPPAVDDEPDATARERHDSACSCGERHPTALADDTTAEWTPFRELRDDERRVDWIALREAMDTAPPALAELLTPILEPALTAEAERIDDAGIKAARVRLSPQVRAELVAATREWAEGLARAGMAQVKREKRAGVEVTTEDRAEGDPDALPPDRQVELADKPDEPTKRDAFKPFPTGPHEGLDLDDLIEQSAADTAEALAARVEATASSAARAALASGKTVKETALPGILQIAARAARQAAQGDPTAPSMTAQSYLNLGRELEVAQTVADGNPVERVFRSALLDDNVCQRCEDRDVGSYGDYEYGSAKHMDNQVPDPECAGGSQCRCVEVSVFADEGSGART